MSGPVDPAETLVVPAKTGLDQRRAADPRASAWVSANAGAGKTKVLTDRVLRLLLAGAPPGRILCLTFTKAAAATMAIRIFERLGQWVALDDASLRAELVKLDGEAPDAERLRLARRLFARAVETPGGLKIETIHAFCERILHMAPFEANVPAGFAVLDDGQAEEVLAEATRETLALAASGDVRLRDALERVSIDAAGEALIKVLRDALRWREALLDEAALAATLERLRDALHVKPDATAAGIERHMIEGGIPSAEWPAVIRVLQATGKSYEAERAESLLAALAAATPSTRLEAYREVFFTKTGTLRSERAIVTKAIDPALKERLLAEQARLNVLDDRLKAAHALERTAALLTLAHEIRARVEAKKARLGALDFDDLIRKTLELLRRDGEAAWILYKLDRGIDHVLVDEAQDTNPAQWEILRRITEDFTAGEGARTVSPRTLFAVGDPKQSIYGFQGAAPAEFEASRRHWETRTRALSLAFEDVRLDLSFRSAKGVLDAVDATFAVAEHFRGLSFEDGVLGTAHVSARRGAPGLVELWPVERPAEEEEPEAWVLPVDEPDRTSPAVRVAQRVARAVRAWTTQPDAFGRVWSPGDVLVLVRKRGPVFAAAIRALKEAGIPVAGADRLDIGDHIAVMDLVAVGRAALLPTDDLTLAVALKTPLVGLTDDDLTRIAAGRYATETLRDALARHAPTDPAALRGFEALSAWRELSRRHDPFGFYAALLGPEGGRRRLVARLGSEAGDAIDAFLCLAQSAQTLGTPSLTAFLARFETAEHEVKRDLAAVRDDVRVMTVHGAKGLEAPIVVLIDGCEVLGRDPALLPLAPGLPVWAPGRTTDPGTVTGARDALRAKGLEEHNRLLYVAMTRAKDRLVIAPFSGARGDAPMEAWCEMIRAGLVRKAGGLELAEAPYGPVERFTDGTALDSRPRASANPAPAPLAVPEWLTTPADPEPEPPPPLRPSGALAAADRPARPVDGPFAREARLRGSLVHALLERLPAVDRERREAAAGAFVHARAPGMPPERRAAIVDDALRVLDHPDLALAFGPGSRAEVPVAGRVRLPGLPDAAPVSGQIDRLVVTDEAVLVLDFKTSMHPPKPDAALPRDHVLQLALYRALLAEIYPGRAVRAFLVWTAGPLVREVPAERLDDALAAVGAL